MPQIRILKTDGYCYECSNTDKQISDWETVTDEELERIKDFAKHTRGTFQVLELSTVEALTTYSEQILSHIKEEEDKRKKEAARAAKMKATKELKKKEAENKKLIEKLEDIVTGLETKELFIEHFDKEDMDKLRNHLIKLGKNG